MSAMFEILHVTNQQKKETHLFELVGSNNDSGMTTEMCCMFLCGCRRLNYGTKHTKTIFLSV